MTDGLELDLYEPERTGFRLRRLEVFNWGTFNRRVWTLRLDGANGLLTGDIGSGKSTLVDAVTTLLVPPNRVSYNKAAGAEHRERTLGSYVAGHYKTERSQSGSNAKPVALRSGEDYSVLLAVFANKSLQQDVTLAQVFWHKDHSGQPAKLFVVADRDLAIESDFAGFGTEIVGLRRGLRQRGIDVFESFSQYSAAFRRRFGIEHRQALDLFHQTVSMKSVGNLTDFVRTHMLEPSDVRKRIEDLITHFDDLSRAHDAVLVAKAQVEWLTPLVADLDTHDALVSRVAELRDTREHLKSFYVRMKLDLVAERRDRLTATAVELAAKERRVEDERGAEKANESRLTDAIRDSGGDRLERLALDIDAAHRERDRRRGYSRRYEAHCRELRLEPAEAAEELAAQQGSLSELLADADDRIAQLDNELSENLVARNRARESLQLVAGELQGLAGRDTNIDQNMVALRTALCQAVGLVEDRLPFVGELLQVRDRDWEPAVERLLHNFGLSLLVPDSHYAQVVAWVDRTDLRGRLVYYRVRGVNRPSQVPEADSLVHKLDVKPDSEFTEWLRAELDRRFDLVCAKTPEQFRGAARAITKRGQVKFSRERHEKDDRHSLGDRRRYVLGWNNQAKRKALEADRSSLAVEAERIDALVAELRSRRSGLETRKQTVRGLQEFRDFSELDWRGIVGRISALKEEEATVRESSDVLRSLSKQLQDVRAVLDKLERRRDSVLAEIAKNEDRLESAEALIGELNAEPAVEIPGPILARLDALHCDSLAGGRISVESCASLERQIRDELQKQIESLDGKAARKAERIVQAMEGFRRHWPLEAQEMDSCVAAGREYRNVLRRLLTDDLPRFEATFKRQLNVNAIREVAGFQSELYAERERIRQRVARINDSLSEIDYQPETYIRLEASLTPDADIREFQAQLRACTEGALTGSEDDQYSEGKFVKVKEIVGRFQGREGRGDDDRRWTARVTDVRNWFAFAASERLRADDSEHEHYSDSGGKSGGQKEKLAYTILAASLAYQFGLVAGETHSRTFRFVVIDEAFARGSDESARFGLELFRRLNLQLLVVTPMQKIHIIEPYVAHVGFVHNEGGRTSKLRTLAISEYREMEAAARK